MMPMPEFLSVWKAEADEGMIFHPLDVIGGGLFLYRLAELEKVQF